MKIADVNTGDEVWFTPEQRYYSDAHFSGYMGPFIVAGIGSAGGSPTILINRPDGGKLDPEISLLGLYPERLEVRNKTRKEVFCLTTVAFDESATLRGIYDSFEAAKDDLLKNAAWLEEHWYKYAVIENCAIGRIDNVHHDIVEHWFERRRDMGSVEYVECTKPEQFSGIVHWGVP